mgnify:CR=1 FL=1
MLTELLPFSTAPVSIEGARVGLIVVDAGVAFTRVGNLADPTHMVPMVHRIGERWKELSGLGERLHTLLFLDTHHPDIPEPPYPPHGIIGTGEEDLDPDLLWLLDQSRVTVIRKDCINGFVGAIDRKTGENAFCSWVKDNRLDTLLVCGDCTDICVSDFVVSALSARNHGLLTPHDPDTEREAYVAGITGLRIVVLTDACETFDAPGFHDRKAAHHVGLWLMASRGAELTEVLTGH